MERSVSLNGIDGTTGRPLVEPFALSRAAAWSRGPQAPDLVAWLSRQWRALRGRHLGLPLGVHPRDVGAAGWGVVFHRDESPAVRRALEPLVEHRRARLGEGSVRVLDYQPGEEWRDWLARHGAEPGSVRPERVPFYLLLVGPPTGIPYEVQALLAVEYAVGRLAFDGAQDYALHVAGLLDYETSRRVPNRRAAVVFAPRHAFDPVTRLSADELALPLAQSLERRAGQVAGEVGRSFAAEVHVGEAATRDRLEGLFDAPGEAPPPALLFTASHGLGWPPGHPDQERLQGALLCQDWAGDGAPDSPHCFAAADLPDRARVHGMVCFHFACYSAGTPRWDGFLKDGETVPKEIAPRPFVGALPRRLLAHPRGGALGVFGHVDRAWGYSILGESGEAQRLPFENALETVLRGWPLGLALRDFRERFAALSAGLADQLERIRFGERGTDERLAALWVERNDARGYALLGDPAAALRVEDLA